MQLFEPYTPGIRQPENVNIHFLESESSDILLVRLEGDLPDGSKAGNDCEYINQQLGLAMLAFQPIAVIMDFTLMGYRYGNSFMLALNALYQIHTIEGTAIKHAFILSDRNKYGLSSLLSFDIEHPKKGLFYSFEEAYEYVMKRD